jgi:monoamine oxidase
MSSQQHANEYYDVVVVGGGFAGVTAARELGQRGYSVVLLEAKDHLGGRTWFDKRLGTDVELGGTWVHPSQPHTWSEITRYGLEYIDYSDVENKAYWIAGGKSKSGSMMELASILDKGMNLLFEDSRNYFPNPYDPLRSSSIHEIDGMSFAERFKSLGLTAEEADAVEGIWDLNFSSPLDEGGLSAVLRWGSLCRGDWSLFFETSTLYRLKKGTRELHEAIASDGDVEIQLSTPVSAVVRRERGVVVSTRDNRQIEAQAVVVAAPLNSLQNIDFRPALSEGKRAAMKEGYPSRGVRFVVRLKGKLDPFVALAPAGSKINYVHLIDEVDDDSIAVAFGSDVSKIDMDDIGAVETELRKWIPDIEVVATAGFDYKEDEFTNETWSMFRPNMLTRYLEELQRPEEGVFLAGSDIASGWTGYIDGAIESGLNAGRNVSKYLATSLQNDLDASNK